ncbi:MAG TPA: CinA family nicotinamide mononucleotide deamidase-related protein [Flavisolibacter sp.]|nr:CinA family nicotinamide mononucleotide deamidase-related protein [Flavisolibacter sp.]
MDQVTASIITIGDELLIGQVIDTNSAWIAQELNKIGVWLKRRVAVGDVWDEIWQALDEESKKADIILITGGLGPTADDITKPLLSQYFGGKMITDEAALENVKNIFERVLKRPMLEVNLKQAEVPDVCTPIKNTRGTAPGMWFEREGKVFVSMPGVPFEMKEMMTNYVLPQLQQHFTMPFMGHQTFVTYGLGESFLAERINPVEIALPPHIKLAYLPNLGMVRLRFTAKGNNKTAIENDLKQVEQQLLPYIKNVLVAKEDISMETVIARLLDKYEQTVGAAESCTGGYISHLLTANANSSSYFTGSIVCYDKKIKEDVLQVDKTLLQEKGTVDKEVVEQMVAGTLSVLKSDYAIAVTGLMGPGNGGENKPVGTTWIAVGSKEKTISKEFYFRFDRRRNIELTAMNALNLLRLFIIENMPAGD